MNERNIEIQKLFTVLSRHSALIADAFDSTVSFGDRQHNRNLDALASINALKPHEEGVYRLNPRLRDFIADHFVSYQAYQSLTRISVTISQARSQWQEIRNLHESGHIEDIERLERALDDSVGDIAYAIERNLTLINTSVSTQYGNVSSLESKLRQNTFYRQEVANLLKEMQQVEEVFNRISGEAMVQGMPAIRTLVSGRLISRLLNWTLQVKAVHEVITQRLFLARQLEERLRKISRMSLWLRQNKTASGFEMEIAEKSPDAVFGSQSVRVRRQLDVNDSDSLMSEVLIRAVRSMPRQKGANDPATEEFRKPAKVIKDGQQNATMMLEHYELQLDFIMDELQHPGEPISLAAWKAKQQDLEELSEEEWLLYSSVQLETQGFEVKFIETPPITGFSINRHFYDVMVSRQGNA